MVGKGHGDGDLNSEQHCFDFDFLCVCLGTNKTFLEFVTILLNFIFPYKSHFYVVSEFPYAI